MSGKKYKRGVTVGAFDLCHAGHMLMFKEAKERCDYLIHYMGFKCSEFYNHVNIYRFSGLR